MISVIEKEVFNHQLLSFINHSPTPFHAAATMSQLLLANGFDQLQERLNNKVRCAQLRHFFSETVPKI